MKRWTALVLVTTCWSVVRCAGPGRRPATSPDPRASNAARSEPTLERYGSLACWSPAAADSAAPPLRARGVEEGLLLHSDDSEVRVSVLTFARDESRRAHGVYGLQGVKNDITVDDPLDGEPIHWDDLDEAQALARLLALFGVPGDEAAAVVAQQAERWFAPGRRVLFVLRATDADALLGVQSPPGCVAVLVVHQLDAP